MSASSTITPEIWSRIFHIATFIPGEWDTAASKVDTRINYTTGAHRAAYLFVLPLRRSIVEVCRLWYKIGTKLLYASFWGRSSGSKYHRLAAFAHVLVARPHLGRFVKRLDLPWNPTVTDNELIIRHCPNAIILSTSWCDVRAENFPWVRSLPESLRSLEASVESVETAEIIRILFTLPNLETLSMSSFGEAGPSSQYPHLRFPALRQLTLFFERPRIIKSWAPILSNFHAPKLTAFRTDMGKVSSAVTSFPRDSWERLTYFGAYYKGYRYITSTHFLNLRHLHLYVDSTEGQTLPKLKQNFPFHQLEILTLCLKLIHCIDVTEWRSHTRQLLAFPLDPHSMPSLRVLELDWWEGGLEATVKRHASHKDVMSKFLISLGSLAMQAEKRGVCFLEVREGAIYHTPTSMRDVVAACKKQLQ